jgi:hypothetical protein
LHSLESLSILRLTNEKIQLIRVGELTHQCHTGTHDEGAWQQMRLGRNESYYWRHEKQGEEFKCAGVIVSPKKSFAKRLPVMRVVVSPVTVSFTLPGHLSLAQHFKHLLLLSKHR